MPIDKKQIVADMLFDAPNVLGLDELDDLATRIVAAMDMAYLERTDVVSRKVHDGAVDIAVQAGLKAEQKVLDLTDELEQCKIQLQETQDRLADANEMLGGIH